MKLGLTIALAKFLHDDPRGEGRTLRDLVVPALLTITPVLLILRQPDLGTALAICFGAAVVIYSWAGEKISPGAVRRARCSPTRSRP